MLNTIQDDSGGALILGDGAQFPSRAAIAAARNSAATPAAERIPNLGTLKTELKEYHDCTCKCGCYAHDLDAQADRAIAFLRQRAAHRRPNEKLALILDIDDTTLSTYPEMLGADFAYNQAGIRSVARNGAGAGDSRHAAALQGSAATGSEHYLSYRPQRSAARRHGAQSARAGLRQLEAAGDAARESRLADHRSIQGGGSRRRSPAAGYTLALNVGDQWSDLKGKPEAEYSVKYPDPYYFIP